MQSLLQAVSGTGHTFSSSDDNGGSSTKKQRKSKAKDPEQQEEIQRIKREKKEQKEREKLEQKQAKKKARLSLDPATFSGPFHVPTGPDGTPSGTFSPAAAVAMQANATIAYSTKPIGSLVVGLPLSLTLSHILSH